MIFEKLFFNVIAIGLFTVIFLKLIRKNSTSYISILTLQFVGFLINFLELIIGIQFGWILKIIMYLFSIILPMAILWMEYFKKINFPELSIFINAKLLEKMGDIEQAKKLMNRFLAKNPNSCTINKLLAETYEKEENYGAAISAYQKVVELNKNDFECKYKLANVLNKEKQNKQAIEILQEALRIQPENQKMTELLGNIFIEQELYKEAVSVYMSALRYHPGSYELYYDLGIACTLLNDFQRAKEFYEKAAQLNSLLHNAKLNLGQIALMYGDLDEAENFFMAAIKGQEVEAGSYYYLAQVAILKGDEDKARNYMNVAVELDARIYKQLQKDPVFEPIKDEVIPPKQENQEERTNRKQLSKKERKANNHLAKTCILIESLGSRDLENFRNREKLNKTNEFEQKEKGQ